MTETRDALHGTLDALILKTLSWGPRHGYAIGRWLRETSGDAIQVEEGSLYPALYRMERLGWIEAEWGTSELGRRARFYTLTPAGRRQLRADARIYDELAEAMSREPGVVSAAVTSAAPLGPGGWSNGLVPEGKALGIESSVDAYMRIVTPQIFATMRIPLVRGRLFTDRDRAGAERVMVISETLAKKLWPGEDAIGLVLAALGIYSVIAYFVGVRTHEIGVRMALGASPRNVVGLMTWQGMRPVLAGVAIGGVGALAATRLLASSLQGVSATDPATFAVVVALMVGVGVLASLVPARRATRVDPLVALRE